MPAPHDLDPPAMTESERLEKRRFEAGFVFETMHTCEPDQCCRVCKRHVEPPLPHRNCILR